MRSIRALGVCLPIVVLVGGACDSNDGDESVAAGGSGVSGAPGAAGAPGVGGLLGASGTETNPSGGAAGSGAVGVGGGATSGAGPGGAAGGGVIVAGAAGLGTAGVVSTAGSSGAPIVAGAAGVAGVAGVAGAAMAGADAGGAAGLGWGGYGALPDVTCRTFNEECTTGSECCSGVCDPVTNRCASNLTQCQLEGEPCTVATECCNLVCDNGVCGTGQCVSDNQACDSNEECCSATCTDGVCEPLNTECLTAGNSCVDDSECCSHFCHDGVCEWAASFCIQSGDICAQSADCCSALCLIGPSGVGTCAEPPSGSTRCSGVEGTICSTCNDCCSRVCAPYGTQGIMVCQPAQGCRVLGELCRRDEDCCGGDARIDMPGLDGANVVCQKESPDAVLGVCRNPTNPGCSPQGNICHYKADETYACTSSSAPASCCGATGAASDACQLDSLGVPRCNALTECRVYGETCTSPEDCCDDVPCVPDEFGVLRCYQPETEDPCVPLDGPCTVDADCCPPYTCIRPVGSILGTCGTVVPPGTGGAGGQPGAGGTAGTPGVGGAPSTCALYGQICDVDADCCNDVPCTDGICKLPPG